MGSYGTGNLVRSVSVSTVAKFYSRVEHVLFISVVVSNGLKNVHLVLVNCLREACPETFWLGY